LGGGILLALQLALIVKPSLIGLSDSSVAVRLSFVSVGVWWALFTLPLLRDVREARAPRESVGAVLRGTFAQLRRTLAELRLHRQAFGFLLAFWLYNDGIGTFTRMGVVFGAELNIGRSTLIGAILAVQILGFPFSLAFGALARRLGAKRAILVGIAGYCLLCLFALFLRTALHFWILAVGVSMFQGGTQAISRSLFASMIPHQRSGEFFGFYNLSSKFAGILGTSMVAVAGPLFGSSRYGVLALLILFVAGAMLLLRLPVAKTAQ
jgi:UMF1 family MFS transporter